METTRLIYLLLMNFDNSVTPKDLEKYALA
jgi:hypothetical protein